jgi:hypothetical protein
MNPPGLSREIAAVRGVANASVVALFSPIVSKHWLSAANHPRILHCPRAIDCGAKNCDVRVMRQAFRRATAIGFNTPEQHVADGASGLKLPEQL